ncbi:MAG TPA: sigma-70 family RNA polymerase sigma factor [Gaiellaceae bacterium]|nr:sigma-70 family RNA polymerase sigma factor [Gaiellaceae bacterium]
MTPAPSSRAAVAIDGQTAGPEQGAARPLDAESQAWLTALRGEGPERDEAVARLHELLVRAARFEVAGRRPSLPHLRGGDLAEIVEEAAGDAAVSILARLDDFRGASRFTTWAYKFALYEAAVKLRRRAWQGRELPLEPESWTVVPSTAPQPSEVAERAELMSAIRDGIEAALSRHQRQVLVSLALNGVPIDVLAERLGTTRGALYKTLHDARKKLRAHLAAEGFDLEALEMGA